MADYIRRGRGEMSMQAHNRAKPIPLPLIERTLEARGRAASRVAPDGVPYRGELDRHRSPEEWNETHAGYLGDKCVDQLFEEQVRRSPGAWAAVFGEQRLTYRELNQRAGELARSLSELGVGPETLVGLCLRRSPDLLVGVLGILKAGGAFLPLDPAWPNERIATVVQDAHVSLMLGKEALLPRLQSEFPDLQLLSLDAPDHGLRIAHPRELRSGAASRATPISRCESLLHSTTRTSRSDKLAYVIYTSGSTGKPKGVMISHRSLANYLCWCAKAYPFLAGEGVPVHSSIAFDFTFTTLLGTLLAGSTVHLLPEEHGVEALSTALRECGNFSLVKITPAHLDLLSQQLSAREAARCTRAFIIGGENLPGQILTFWQQHAPDSALINEYGPTEATVGCCVYPVPKDQRISGAVPIGRPIANTRLFVLDERMEPAPDGAPGELFIAGDGLARGYLNRPELTAGKFLPDPFSREPDARLYRTGDLVRWRPAGNLEDRES